MVLDEALCDQAYDEAIPVETDDEELATPDTSECGDSPTEARSPVAPRAPARTQGADMGGSGSRRPRDESQSGEDVESSGSDSSTESSDESKKGDGPILADAYNPNDYKDLKVSSEVEELFKYIVRYKPHAIELDTSLKPFIPELIPCIGEVDAFLKIPRPDGKPSGLGKSQVDEPTLNPSDPSILDLQLRSLSKTRDLQPIEVRSIENADKFPKDIENWIRNIDELNRTKPAPTVQYSRRMPDIEQLMQVWPGEFEDYLSQNALPELADLELDLASYIRVIASILDVPVYNQMTETLHVIFTLYSEFKSNQHFSQTGGPFGHTDPYNFGSVPNFAPMHATGSPVFGGASMAPSRAPSPTRQMRGVL